MCANATLFRYGVAHILWKCCGLFQVHPHGWCAISRNTDMTENTEVSITGLLKSVLKNCVFRMFEEDGPQLAPRL